MPDKFSLFIKTLDKTDADKAILLTEEVSSVVDNLENLGKNTIETVENLFKPSKEVTSHPPLPPKSPVPDYQESAFLKPKDQTTLYTVTTKEAQIPEVTASSNLFKHTSYRIRGLTATANYKSENNTYGLFAGEHVGLGWSKKESSLTTAVSAKYNVSTGRTTLEYKNNNPAGNYSISVFHKGNNNGGTVGYAQGHFASCVSADKNSASLNCSYNKKNKDYTLELGAYATTGEKYSNPYAGVSARMTF